MIRLPNLEAPKKTQSCLLHPLNLRKNSVFANKNNTSWKKYSKKKRNCYSTNIFWANAWIANIAVPVRSPESKIRRPHQNESERQGGFLNKKENAANFLILRQSVERHVLQKSTRVKKIKARIHSFLSTNCRRSDHNFLKNCKKKKIKILLL